MEKLLDKILQQLEERKEWAENGILTYSDNEKLRDEYQARVEEIQNLIYIIENEYFGS